MCAPIFKTASEIVAYTLCYNIYMITVVMIYRCSFGYMRMKFLGHYNIPLSVTCSKFQRDGYRVFASLQNIYCPCSIDKCAFQQDKHFNYTKLLYL